MSVMEKNPAYEMSAPALITFAVCRFPVGYVWFLQRGQSVPIPFLPQQDVIPA